MGGNITKTAMGSMTLRANQNLEIHGDNVVSIAKEKVLEKGEDGGMDIKIGFYVPPTTEQSPSGE